MFLKRLHVPVGICYSGGKEGMRHSNWGKPKKKSHLHQHFHRSPHFKCIMPSQVCYPSLLQRHLWQGIVLFVERLHSGIWTWAGDSPINCIIGFCKLHWLFFILAMWWPKVWTYTDSSHMFGSVWSQRCYVLLLWHLVEFFRCLFPSKIWWWYCSIWGITGQTALQKHLGEVLASVLLCYFILLYFNSNFSSPFFHRYKLWGVWKWWNEEKDTIEAEYNILDCLQILRRDWRLF